MREIIEDNLEHTLATGPYPLMGGYMKRILHQKQPLNVARRV